MSKQEKKAAVVAHASEAKPVLDNTKTRALLKKEKAAALELAEKSETMLDALTALESELLGEEAGEAYDVDKLLGEYGFEAKNDS